MSTHRRRIKAWTTKLYVDQQFYPFYFFFHLRTISFQIKPSDPHMSSYKSRDPALYCLAWLALIIRWIWGVMQVYVYLIKYSNVFWAVENNITKYQLLISCTLEEHFVVTNAFCCAGYGKNPCNPFWWNCGHGCWSMSLSILYVGLVVLLCPSYCQILISIYHIKMWWGLGSFV